MVKRTYKIAIAPHNSHNPYSSKEKIDLKQIITNFSLRNTLYLSIPYSFISLSNLSCLPLQIPVSPYFLFISKPSSEFKWEVPWDSPFLPAHLPPCPPSIGESQAWRQLLNGLTKAYDNTYKNSWKFGEFYPQEGEVFGTGGQIELWDVAQLSEKLAEIEGTFILLSGL